MTTIWALADWTVRSSILILAAALLLRVLRVKDPAVRLAAWGAVLCGSLAIPLLTVVLPKMPLPVMRAASLPSAPPPTAYETVADREVSPSTAPGPAPFDWGGAGAIVYGTVAFTLLLRLCVGLAIGRRLVRKSSPAGARDGIEFRESDAVMAPVTLGIARSVIVLPAEWREWEHAKLDAVLAHERSHIRRNDPALQAASAFHRALLWASPLSWILHRQIVRLAEEASDDAAVEATSDRASYAEILLEFMQRGGSAQWPGVAMARYGRPDERIHRILDETALSRGVTRWSIAAILVLGMPLAYVVAAGRPQAAPVAPSEPAPAASAAPVSAPPVPPAASQTPAAPAHPPAPAQPTGGAVRRYMIFDGDSTSGSWDSQDRTDVEGLQTKFGRHFAWFRQNGNEYVITDAGLLEEFHKANEPQREVNRMQSEVNGEQSKVNSLQADVNSRQSVINTHQGEVNRRQEILNRLQSGKTDAELIEKLKAAVAELEANKGKADSQESVNLEQAKVNEAQARVNQEQQKVNAMQSKVNDQQHRVSAEYSRRMHEIFDSALRRHLAQKLM